MSFRIKCSRCRKTKSADEFHNNKRVKSGKFPYCKKCSTAAALKWQQEHKEQAAATARAYRKKNVKKLRRARRAWYKRNAEYMRARRRETRLERRLTRFEHGLDRRGYESLLAIQEGRCAICRCEQETTRRKHRLSIDHCHETGKARGLLCSTCNTGLGMFKDSVAFLRIAADYLEQHGNKAF